MRAGVLLLAAVMVVAGCVGSEEAAEVRTPTNQSGPNESDPAPGTIVDEVLDATPVQTALHFQGDRTLTNVTPADGDPVRVPLQPFTEGVVNGFGDLDAWTRAATGEYGRLITALSTTFFWTRDAPGVNHPGLPGFGALVFLEDSTSAMLFSSGPPTVAADQVHEITIDLTPGLPTGGLVVPPGATLHALPFGTYHPTTSAAGTDYILVASTSAATRLDLTVAPVLLPETRDVVLAQETFPVTGDGCSDLDPPEAHAILAFEVPPDALGARIVAERQGGQGTGDDIDLRVYGPSGQQVAFSHLPFSREVVDLYAPNMEAIGSGTWTADAYSCAAQEAEIEITVTGRMPLDP